MKRKPVKTVFVEDTQNLCLSTLTNAQLVVLDREHDLHIAGVTKSYSRDEAIQIIKGNCSLFK